MSDSPDSGFTLHDPERSAQLLNAKVRFERAWDDADRGGPIPDLDAFLNELPEEFRDELRPWLVQVDRQRRAHVSGPAAEETLCQTLDDDSVNPGATLDATQVDASEPARAAPSGLEIPPPIEPAPLEPTLDASIPDTPQEPTRAGSLDASVPDGRGGVLDPTQQGTIDLSSPDAAGPYDATQQATVDLGDSHAGGRAAVTMRRSTRPRPPPASSSRPPRTASPRRDGAAPDGRGRCPGSPDTSF